MTLDIIIPFLDDGSGFLKDCLDSISAQAFKDVNIILEKDDPSAPLGVAAMRNRGLAKAGADYVMFMDSDDYLSRTALTAAMYEALKNPGSIIRIPKKRCFCKYSASLAIEDREYAERKKSRIPANEDLISDENGEEESNGTGDAALLPSQERNVKENVHHVGDNPPSTFYDTCLGQLIPRRLLEGLKFEENYRYYCDIPFLARLYERSDVISTESAGYYKRIHNDPVNCPSLDQEVNPGRFTEYCNAARLAAGYMSDPRPVYDYVCQFIVSRTVIGRNPKALRWSDTDMTVFSDFVADAAYPAISDFKGESRRILTAFRHKNIKKIRRLIQRHHRRLKIHDFKKSEHQRRLFFYNKLFLKLPVKKNVVLFSSFFGRAYCDSCRGIYEYMVGKYPDKTFVWAMNDDSIEIPGKCRRVHTKTLAFFYWMAVSGTFVTNVRQPEWYTKRKDAFLLQTWHGTPLKRLVFDLEDVYAAKPADYKRLFYKQACEWDVLLSDNPFSTEAFGSAFKYPEGKILELGYPRNDILFAPDRAERAEKIKKKLGLPSGKQIVLYAPTWRDDEAEGTAQYGFTLKLDLKKMKKVSDKYHFILRTHYLISENLHLTEDERRFVTDLSDYNDIAELYLVSDILITDYSSTFFDFANLGRPMLFYVYDLEKYRDILHGFYFDMEEVCPGPMLYNSDEVLSALRSIDKIEEEYAEKYESFRKRFCALDDGKASERVVKAVFER